jgi:hypothetical protein
MKIFDNISSILGNKMKLILIELDIGLNCETLSENSIRQKKINFFKTFL